MSRQHVEDQYAKGSDCLLCSEYKTSSCYGDLAKFIPAGSWRAFEVFNKLPKQSGRFLDPPSGADLVPFSSYLHRFGCLHFRVDNPPDATLIRKMFHSVILRMSKEKEILKLMTKVDAHSAKVAKQVYTIMSAEADAELGKIVFEHIFGEPVPWPSEQAPANPCVCIG
jgi:hypothetical protein